ncbi:MAG: hypothetical protein COW73_08285 [Nitrospirae bacterium CG18_big_fil_WC_8_21_14_2_50_70_55]|nr:MAG: hypothetical protein COW73_08285 [Nitrospirae bacterium CG18_big_fil_WC_8_21_14_2_50_70_55]PIU79052.1 MAG: hypothetical protein COS73_05200 [Nitrospirae bacterium CG06_land_8_20_14_3_00_70_43]PIW82454.1 MAG: hypothetical protein COZ96_08735 [Nitrospirae bacterium CG_4_8_14_3_um_filter_70_85]PIX83166.1 MAG: hypothetical protein COZ33_06850 [Nitrospirae bacterium CG_4_10_14_3_um_filter_70_108]PJB95453.1 MAG: hypothetical protein CO080_07520 [Nitrospirae bacterium CG_4_9_14_0_8_um_filter_7
MTTDPDRKEEATPPPHRPGPVPAPPPPVEGAGRFLCGPCGPTRAAPASPDYRPIACGVYSRLEVAILHRTPISCAWTDDAGAHHEARLLPLDLRTRDHAEYLVAETPAGQVEIRLDRLRPRDLA